MIQYLLLLLIKLLVPLDEATETVTKRRRMTEAEVAFKKICIDIGHEDIAWQHGHEFYVGLKVVVCRYDLCRVTSSS